MAKANSERFIINFKCFTKKRNKNVCDKKSISQQYIEDIVVEATQNFLQHTNLKAIANATTECFNKSVEKDLILENLNKELQDNNKKLANLLLALENGVFNDTTNERMKELEIANKELKEKIASRELLTIKYLNENVVYDYLCSFKDLDYSLNNAKQRLVDMFVNRVVLFDDHCDIYFNTNDDKSTWLKLSEQSDPEKEIEFENNSNSKTNTTQNYSSNSQNCNKKEQPDRKGSDCSLLAENTGFEPADAVNVNGFQDRRFKPLSQFSTICFAPVRKPLQRFAKTNAGLLFSCCGVECTCWFKTISFYLGLRPKTAALNHSTGSHDLFCLFVVSEN